MYKFLSKILNFTTETEKSISLTQPSHLAAMDTFTVQTISEDEADEILKFKNSHFHNHDPVERALPGTKHKSNDAEVILKGIKDGFALKAVDKETSTLVGFVIGVPTSLHVVDELKRSAATVDDTNRAYINSLVAYLESKANIFGRFKVERRIHVPSLCVHSDYRGHKIGTKLFEAAIAEAKSGQFELITVHCSSSYSARIAVCLKMDLVFTVTYQEYNDHVGKQLFTPVGPHTEIATYALVL